MLWEQHPFVIVTDKMQRGSEWVRNQEINIYREVQRNTQMAMKAIDTISDKVVDEGLSDRLSKKSLKYAQLRNRAYDKLLEAKAEPYRDSYMENLMLTGTIRMNTLLNTGTSHIAELMIKGSNRGVLEMTKVLHHNEAAGAEAVALAGTLLDFETKNMEELKSYL